MKEGQIVKITSSRFDFLIGFLGETKEIFKSSIDNYKSTAYLVFLTSRGDGSGQGIIELVFAEEELSLATSREAFLYYLYGSGALLNE